MTIDSVHGLARPFWAAADQGQLQVSYCTQCQLDIWYPRELCPHCEGEIHWRRLGGDATLLSWTTVRRQINGSFDVPYTPAIVIPDDAPTVQLVTQLFLDDGQEPHCDMPLEVAFKTLTPLQGKPFVAPVFTARKTVL